MVSEALVVCSDKSLSTGITIWDIETGEHLLHIPTCASLPHGFLCLNNQFLIASQVQRQGSVGEGVIFVWPLNKPQAPFRNYPLEVVGPLSSTEDGSYLAGGTPYGNVYFWEVSSGRMLRSWHGHTKSVNCLRFSNDNCFLISGSIDGEIRVWSTISLSDVEEYESVTPFIHSWSEHKSSITGLLTFRSCDSVMASSSHDGTCKIWELVTGKLIRTYIFSQAITAIASDRQGQYLFSGNANGRIFVNLLDIGLDEENVILGEDQCLIALSGHSGAITALSFSLSGLFLISASEDCTACLWDIKSWKATKKYDHKKGRITNIVVIPKSKVLHGVENHHRGSNQPHIALLDKCPQPKVASKVPVTLLPAYCSLEEGYVKSGSQTITIANQQIMDLEQERTPEAIQMKVDSNMEKRIWATTMAKQVTGMNKHLQSRLLDLMQARLEDKSTEKRKKFKFSSAVSFGEVLNGCPM
ncbi:hypothetical protein ACHQM5_005472 [Ranunculus cassubicifolius]